MPVVGQAETVSVVFTGSNGVFDPATVRLRYSGPGVAAVTKTYGIDPVVRASMGSYWFTIPGGTVAGVWLYRWEGLDSGGNLMEASDGAFTVTSSAFVAQGSGFPYPYGFILQNATDVNAIRDALGFQAAELSDTLFAEPDFEPAAEQFVMSQVPAWSLILNLGPPAAPTVSVQTNASSNLPASSYFVRLVGRVGTTATPPGPESAAVAVAAGQQLVIAIPAAPGITAYDVYAGVSPGQDFLQISGAQPGTTAVLASFSLAGTPIQQVAFGDQMALKAAVVAFTCAFLCRRFQRYAPARLKTLNYEEEFKHDWRQEEDRYLANGRLYLGMVSSYSVTAAPALIAARGMASPTDPSYQPGSDPHAVPNLLAR